MKRWTGNKLLVWLAAVLLAMASLYMLLLLKPLLMTVYSFLKAVLAPFIIALIVSYVLNPVVTMLSKRKMPRTAAVLLIYAVFVAAVTVVLMNLIPMFLAQLRELNEHLPQLSMKARSWMADINNSKWMPDSVSEGIQNAFKGLESWIVQTVGDAVNAIGATINMLFVLFIIPFLVFYMLKDFRLLEQTALKVVPEKHRRHTVKMLVDIDDALGHYIRGQLIVCVIIGVLAYTGYWLIGMPYPLLLAGLVMVFNIIPYLGPFFGAAPALAMAATVSLRMVLLVVVVNLIVQVLEGNVISPQVVGRTLHMHPLLIIFVLLVGGQLAGVIGLILAVPVFAALKVVFLHWRVYYRNRRTAETD